jgi:hypothetical protein
VHAGAGYDTFVDATTAAFVGGIASHNLHVAVFTLPADSTGAAICSGLLGAVPAVATWGRCTLQCLELAAISAEALCTLALVAIEVIHADGSIETRCTFAVVDVLCAVGPTPSRAASARVAVEPVRARTVLAW